VSLCEAKLTILYTYYENRIDGVVVILECARSWVQVQVGLNQRL